MTAADALIWAGAAVLAVLAIGKVFAVMTAIAIWRQVRRDEREFNRRWKQ
jgi:hypothetical protein